MKEFIVIGGANGSGKTTLARELAAAYGIEYLGADDIAAELNAASPAKAAIEAARVFSRRLGECLAGGASVLVESTLAGVSLQKFVRQARAQGFTVRIYFVYLDSVELCLRRIAARVARGGHPVPPADVQRRFQRANQNFWNVYKPLADTWSLIFNIGDDFQQIALGDENGVIIFDEAGYEKWLKMATN